MKTTLSVLVAAVVLLAPVTGSAYFKHQVQPTEPQYVQDPSLDLLPGWPDWIGRLNVFSEYLFGKRFDSLNETERSVAETLSKNWPDWIGVPYYLR